MKEIKLQTEPGKKNPLLAIWERGFINDTSKFISATHIKPSDLGAEFTDDAGETWKILGMLEGKDMPCQNSRGQIFIWDRWKVSEYMYPDKHAATAKLVEYIPMKVKPKRTKKEEQAYQAKLEESSRAEENLQLDLFSVEDESEETE